MINYGKKWCLENDENIQCTSAQMCMSSCIAYIAEEHDAGWWMTEWWKGSYTPLKHLLQVFWVD